ncbi:hypothetical protein OAM82_03205 [Candidatus Thioglobus sp.]|nr:hypothetical protein [Candidatus Thioglobus sp.]
MKLNFINRNNIVNNNSKKLLITGGVDFIESTDFVKNYEHKEPMYRMGKIQDLLSTLFYLIPEDALYTNSQDIAVDGGFLAW